MTFLTVNGRAVPESEACIPPSDRGFRYGDGVFETLRVQGGVPYQFEWHMGRLARGLEALRIAFAVESLPASCAELLTLNHVGNGLLRIQVTRGAGGRGYLPDANRPPTCVVETLPLPELPGGPVSLWLSSVRRPSAQALPTHLKLCQGVGSTLARLEAQDNGCFDALQLGEKGHIAETSSANIFWLQGGVLHTPSLECGALEGATRAAIMRLSPFPVREVSATPEALAQAEAVCLTNAAWNVLPVARLLPAATAWDSAALAGTLGQALALDIAEHIRDRTGSWQRHNKA